MKRSDAIGWDAYFMGIAKLSALRSKDPNTQVGACIVNGQKRIVGIGYNGFPRGCDDDDYSWQRDGEYLETKYPYVVHAELNAILNSIQNLAGCTIYVSLFPCNECAKAIIQSGISKVVYEEDKYCGTEGNQASKKMFHDAGVMLEQLPYTTSVTVEVKDKMDNNHESSVDEKIEELKEDIKKGLSSDEEEQGMENIYDQLAEQGEQIA